MKKYDYFLFTILIFVIITIIVWVRHDLPFFQPILESSLLFFQLILAATVIAILRNIVGIRTFGVFGPTIIAFGIVSSGLLWGLALYLDVFLIAFVTSLALYPLAIASSHRIAIIITTTVMAITTFELLGELYHINLLETSILFPVLITSWLADRYVIQVKEIDWIEPSKRLLGTVIVIIIAYFLISYQPLILLIALNPETWGILIVINIILALKVGFKFSEHFRFKPIINSGEKSNDVLGLIKRNRDYIFKYNPSNLFPHISKDKMKITFHQLNIPTPETYCIIQDKKDLKFAEEIMKKKHEFVIKPGSGLGGEGILVVEKLKTEPSMDETPSANEDLSDKNKIYLAQDKELSLNNLKNHILQILDGQFSTEWDDVAIIEERIIPDPSIRSFYWKGVPDIRVIVFEGFPIMAMTRLPTLESGGAANIHKGAISMGLTIAGGRGINPYWRGHGGAIKKHPDTNAVLTEMKIPSWSKLLEVACLAQGASRLGYAGVDIVLTKKGPKVLEVNKRPGIEIQNTNLAGLLKRIRFIEQQLPIHRFKPVEEKVKLAQKWDTEGWNWM